MPSKVFHNLEKIMEKFAKIVGSLFSGVGIAISVATLGILIVLAFFSPAILGFVFISASALAVVKVVAIVAGILGGVVRYFFGSKNVI